ncbi:MAG: ABC transporter ATP-binding protein [Actinobacteria bacterium]|nr:ABC transporter ATP-binding protein [Actinomycetota bacterium]
MGTAVELVGVSKRFKLYHERYHTLKERLIFFKRSLSYEEFWALDDVSFDISQGSTFGLIGANGSGKTTLLKIIAGILRPTSGEVGVNGRIAALLELGAGFHPDLTGRENIYLNASVLGLGKKEVDKKLDSIVDFAELGAFIDNPVRNYSSGMYVRLGFAVAVHLDPDILLVDEVLAVGDEAFQEKCLARIREFQREGRTIILVTHAVDQVREMCDHAVFLDHGRMAGEGDPSEVVRGYRNRLSTTPTGEKVSVIGNVDIPAVRLLGPDGAVSETFHPGESMVVEADLDAHERIEDPVFSVNIHDSAGRHVFGTNTHLRHMKSSLDPGPSRLRITFPVLAMKEGRFRLTVGVHSRDGLTIFATTDAAGRFEMRSDSGEPGSLYMPCNFTVEQVAETRRGVVDGG